MTSMSGISSRQSLGPGPSGQDRDGEDRGIRGRSVTDASSPGVGDEKWLHPGLATRVPILADVLAGRGNWTAQDLTREGDSLAGYATFGEAPYDQGEVDAEGTRLRDLRRFEGVIKRAINLIANQQEVGVITRVYAPAWDIWAISA